jgi:hypothetical protein
MSGSFDPEDPDGLGETFAQDLRSAFPEVELPERVVQDHVATMISATQLLAEEGASVLEQAMHPAREGLTTPRRRWMRTRLIKRVVAVTAGLLLSLSGLAFAGAFEGSDDTGTDDTTTVVSHLTGDDQGENEVADEQGEDADDQGEDADEQGGNEDADDQGENEDGDDQGENEDADDQGEDGDDQGENEDADDQGDDADEQGEDGDDQDEHGDSHDGGSDDEQGNGGDSED